jgi:hypothetical protein
MLYDVVCACVPCPSLPPLPPIAPLINGYNVTRRWVSRQDVTQCTLEEVALLLRGPAGSIVELTFLETRTVKLEMERCVQPEGGGESTPGIRWRQEHSDFVVEGMEEGGDGFGPLPKAGDRLIGIDGQVTTDPHCAVPGRASVF